MASASPCTSGYSDKLETGRLFMDACGQCAINRQQWRDKMEAHLLFSPSALIAAG